METLLLSGAIAACFIFVRLWKKNSILQEKNNQLQAELAQLESAQEKIRLNEARLKAVLEVATDKMTLLSSDGTIVDAFTRSGFHSTVPERRSVGKQIHMVYDQSISSRYQQAVEQALLTDRMQSFIYESEYCGRLYGREVRLIACGEEIIVVERDATERVTMAKQLSYLSSYDPLTGLLNYNRFEQEMRQLAEGEVGPTGIVVCDLDCIRLVNDMLGRAEGDKLITATADILKRCFRPEDFIARIGGDEFAVILPNITADELTKICLKLEEETTEYNAMLPNARMSLAIGYASSDCPPDIEAAFITANDSMRQQQLLHGDGARQHIIDGVFRSFAARDHFELSHPERIEEYVVKMADALALGPDMINRLRLLARYHDIGDAGLDERIALKPGRLTGRERQETARHSEIGSRIARSVPELSLIADLILKHHEQWDGHGYPLGLKFDEIPMECRILAIADAYEVMTAGRPYASARDKTDAIAELRRGAGHQFDPNLVDTFIAIIDDAKVAVREG